MKLFFFRNLKQNCNRTIGEKYYVYFFNIKKAIKNKITILTHKKKRKSTTKYSPDKYGTSNYHMGKTRENDHNN